MSADYLKDIPHSGINEKLVKLVGYIDNPKCMQHTLLHEIKDGLYLMVIKLTSDLINDQSTNVVLQYM